MRLMKFLKDNLLSDNRRLTIVSLSKKARGLSKALILSLSLLLFSCSLPPDKPLTAEDIDNTRLYNRFVIEESPDVLLYALNKNGEAIVRATYRNVPVYIKVFATSKGILWYVYPRER